MSSDEPLREFLMLYALEGDCWVCRYNGSKYCQSASQDDPPLGHEGHYIPTLLLIHFFCFALF